MSKLNLGILAAILGIFPLQSHGAVPTAAHKELSAHLANGIEWAQHLRTEVKKRGKLDLQHLEQESKGTLDALSAMQSTADKILSEAPSERKEGHFKEMQKYREAARMAAMDFIAAKQKPERDYLAMSSAAEKIIKNLEDAKHWHDLELSELEKNPKD